MKGLLLSGLVVVLHLPAPAFAAADDEVSEEAEAAAESKSDPNETEQPPAAVEESASKDAPAGGSEEDTRSVEAPTSPEASGPTESEANESTSRGLTFDAMRDEKRVALVIGNGDYESSPLANPPKDAHLMAETRLRCDMRRQPA